MDLRDSGRLPDAIEAAAPPSEPDVESYVLRLLDESRDEAKFADSKTSILFAAVATVIAFLVGGLIDGSSEVRTNGDGVVALGLLALGAFFVSLVLLALAVTPRLGQPEAGQARYFVEHAAFPDSATLRLALERDAAHAVDRHVQQLATLGRIVRRKYQYFRWAMQALSVGIAIGVLTAIVATID